MEGVIIKHVKKMLADTSPKPQGLEGELQTTLSALNDAAALNAGGSPRSRNADKYFSILQATCESKVPKLVELALSCIHVLIERCYLQGKAALKANDGLHDGNTGEEKELTDEQADVDVEQLKGEAGTQRTLMDHIIEVVTKCSEINDNGVHIQAIKVLLTAITSTHCEVHDASLLLSIQACFHIHLVSTNEINKITAKAALTQMVSNTIARMEMLHQVLVLDGDKDSKCTSAADAASFPTSTHKDSFLIFRALCKLSMKGAQSDFELVQSSGTPFSGVGNSLAVQNKLLSLEMILVILKKSGQAFHSGDKFTDAIRKYLCMSLLGNCTSQIPQVTALSLQIFSVLIEGFKEHLKTEFEVFFTSVFLKILESENSSCDQKLQVVEVFHKICQDSTTMLEFFINYDCDMDSTDVLRKIIEGFARIVKASRSEASHEKGADESNLNDEKNIRRKGLEGLVMILRSLLTLKGIRHVTGITDTDTPSTNIPDAEREDGVDYGSEFPTSSEQSTRMVDAFDRKQRMQEQIEVGILKFNQSPKKGILYLIEVGHISKDAKNVAKLLHLEDRLDKTLIGDFLAREIEYMDGFATEVLHHYVDMLDFSNMSFDLALRHFLTGFRLPGEAQKIDRLMEKFAERYYLQNSTEFASADMAFILAFSTIMLQTNLHNPAIKEDKRMTKDQFIKQNKGITSDGELSDDLLSQIYDRIAAEEISMTGPAESSKKAKKEESPTAFTNFQGTPESRRIDAFNDERKEMMRASQTLFKKKHASRGHDFVKLNAPLDAPSSEAFVRPMFDVAWGPLVSVLSHAFELHGDEDSALVAMSLEGFKHAIRLACRLGLPLVRSTYMNALSKFTALDMVRQMKGKNLEAVKALLSVAFTEGDFLGAAWKEVFTCISRLSRLEQYGVGAHLDEDFFTDTNSKHGLEDESSHNKLKSMEDANASLVSSGVDMLDLDRIFLNSSKLSQDSVVDFVRELCAVSKEELLIAGSSATTIVVGKKETLSFTATPRIFSLQKLVEVADFNMHSRSRIAWSAIWSMLASHFEQVGTDQNLSVALYAIDSLKQLSIKFLQKEELSNFNFQRVFLRPFEVIMSRTQSIEVCDLVLRCIDMMVLACAGNIRSGWRTIFNIFELCSAHKMVEVPETAFSIIERLMQSWLDFLFQNDAVALMNCLVTFVGGRHTGLSLRALTHLRVCADKLSEGSRIMVKAAHAPSPSLIDAGDASVFGSWWPLLFGLSTMVADNRLEVRIKALDTLDGILEVHGELFSQQAWIVVFRGVMFPMVDSAKTDMSIPTMSRYPAENPLFESRGDSWIGTVGMKVMNVHLKHFKRLVEEKKDVTSLLPDFLGMLESCICHSTEALARLGVSTLGDLILTLSSADDIAAKQVNDFVCRIIRSNLCLAFGQAGLLECSQDIPTTVKASLIECMHSPLNMLINEGGGNRNIGNTSGDRVLTSFGAGDVIEILDNDLGISLKPRQCIQLPWGMLYAPADDPSIVPDARRPSRLSPQQEWISTTRCVMTSMVVSLDIIHVLSVVFHHFEDSLGPTEVVNVLNALETSHWHARSFNEDPRLSLELTERGFMQFPGPGTPPNLLEQEIRTSSEILEITQHLSPHQEYKSVVTPWIKRYTTSVIERYLELDSSLQGTNPLDMKVVDAYKPAVMTVLDGLEDCSQAQYQAFGEWAMPLITKLILCHNFEVRARVSSILPALVRWSSK